MPVLVPSFCAEDTQTIQKEKSDLRKRLQEDTHGCCFFEYQQLAQQIAKAEQELHGMFVTLTLFFPTINHRSTRDSQKTDGAIVCLFGTRKATSPKSIAEEI